MKQDPVYIVFGSDEHPNKAIVGVKRADGSGGGIEICELSNGDRHIYGQDSTVIDDISGIYAILWFFKKESLDSMIDCLSSLRDSIKWEESDGGDNKPGESDQGVLS